MTISPPELNTGDDEIVDMLQIIANPLGILIRITLPDDQVPCCPVADASGHVSLYDELLLRKSNVHAFELDV